MSDMFRRGLCTGSSFRDRFGEVIAIKRFAEIHETENSPQLSSAQGGGGILDEEAATALLPKVGERLNVFGKQCF